MYNNKIKTRPYFFAIGLTFIILIYILRCIIEQSLKAPPLFLLKSVSAISLLIIIFRQIHKSWWKCKPFSFIFNVPYIEGTYNGFLTSSYLNEDQQNIIKKIKIEIIQPWAFEVYLKMEFADLEDSKNSSTSKSLKANIYKSVDDFWMLDYSYLNTPNQLYTKEELQMHQGYANTSFSKDFKTIKGTYFNNQNKSHGTIELTKSK